MAVTFQDLFNFFGKDSGYIINKVKQYESVFIYFSVGY